MSDPIPSPLHCIEEQHTSLSSLCAEVENKVPLYKQYFTFRKLGLYAHYVGLGVIMSTVNLCTNVCYYYYDGQPALCANAWSLICIPWGLKLFIALYTDSRRPWGYRRKVYLCAGWIGVCVCTLLLAVLTPTLGASGWISLSLVTQLFLMLADTSADGLSIEIGQIESAAERGQTLATGQRLRFITTLLGALFQGLFVNGPSANPPSCADTNSSCWTWGLTPSQYYGLAAAVVAVTSVPIFFFDEPESTAKQDSFAEQKRKLWSTLSNPTTFFLLLFVAGNGCFSTINSVVIWYLQYNLIGLSNLESGISSVLSALTTTIFIFVFQTFFRQSNWRHAQAVNVLFCAITGLGWIPCFYNTAHLENAWFTVFLDFNLSVGTAFTQVVFGMAVIELAEKGNEATCYELVISTANSAAIINNVLATQLLTLMQTGTCVSNPRNSVMCANTNEVNIFNNATFAATSGPAKFTLYTLVIFAVDLAGLVAFNRFLPKSKEQCRQWKESYFGGCEEGDTVITLVRDLPMRLRALSVAAFASAPASLSLSGPQVRTRSLQPRSSPWVEGGSKSGPHQQYQQEQGQEGGEESRQRRAVTLPLSLLSSTFKSRLSPSRDDDNNGLRQLEIGPSFAPASASASASASAPASVPASATRAAEDEDKDKEKDKGEEERVALGLGLSKQLSWAALLSPKHLMGLFVSDRRRVGVASALTALIVILYMLVCVIGLLDASTACKRAFGGPGCH